MRDWIAVDQAVQRLLDRAADDQERRAIQLAAERSLGPDPDVAGGGQEWLAALDAARDALRFDVADDLESCLDPELSVDTYALVHALRSELERAGVSQVVLARFASVLEQRVTQAMDQTRVAERAALAEWLRRRAQSVEAGEVLVAASERLAASFSPPT